jgi:DNA-directed RNA polymerase specialized sigma24 family protein
VQIEIRGLERLSHRERQVVALKETGLGNDAVARRLGLSPATVATLFNRARSKGYQVVLVISGDPLNVFPADANDDEATEES